ncbi:MAG: site-specific integrase [Propionibacteriaceae bacterium]|jgi:integrase|nr:site-specific integrase [Propionibacteriaceae bacterium]
MAKTKKENPENIRELPSGHWQARYVGPDAKHHCATFHLKNSATQWLLTERKYWESLLSENKLAEWKSPKVREQEAAETLRAVDATPTLAEYAEKWISSGGFRPSYVKRVSSLLKLHILPVLGEYRLNAITRAMVRDWWDGLDKNKRRTADLAFGALRSIMTSAKEDDHEWITENPVRVKGAGGPSNEREASKAAITGEQLRAVVDNMPPRWALGVSIAAWAGLRSGEVRELRRKDLDLEHGKLTVSRSVTTGLEGRVIGQPKTTAGVRTIDLPQPLIEDIRHHLNSWAQIGQEGLLFYAPVGGGNVPENTWRKAYNRACDAAGVSGIPFHELRAHMKTRLELAGATDRETTAIMGHTDMGTSRRYNRVELAHMAGTVERMGEMYAEAMG